MFRSSAACDLTRAALTEHWWCGPTHFTGDEAEAHSTALPSTWSESIRAEPGTPVTRWLLFTKALTMCVLLNLLKTFFFIEVKFT